MKTMVISDETLLRELFAWTFQNQFPQQSVGVEEKLPATRKVATNELSL